MRMAASTALMAERLPARESALEDPTLREKEKLHRKEKLQIAAAAARMVRERSGGNS